ncbi:MAG: DUF1573 domain-containing protein [Pirellulales bacterium]|nr:DUF1573 domain-containing protein [Pirellulales bacterium]
MKSLLALIVCSALVGLGLGGAMAYFEVRPAAPPARTTASSRTDLSEQEDQQKLDLPHAELSETIFDFDRIERGTSMRHDFVVKNSGKAPLSIRFESNTCKCTGVELGGKLVEPGQSITVPPGEQTRVTLEWAAKTPAGPFRHGARFTSNDPRNSSIELEVNGQVVESTSMRPSELLYGTVKAGASKKSHFYLMSFLEEEVEVLDFQVSPAELAEQFEVQIIPAEKSELPSAEAISGLKISATFDSGASLGPFRGWLAMTTNLPGAEKLTVPIIGSVTGPVSIYGPRWNAAKGLLHLGPILSAEGKAVRLNLVVRGEDAQTIEFEVAHVDPSEMKVSLGEPRRMGDELLHVHVPVEVKVPAHTRPLVRMGEPVSSDATIVFKSNHPQAREIKMRVHFAVSR